MVIDIVVKILEMSRSKGFLVDKIEKDLKRREIDILIVILKTGR